jgi:manganese transport protein
MSNRRNLMGDLRNRWWNNLFGIIGLIGLIAILAMSLRLIISLIS